MSAKDQVYKFISDQLTSGKLSRNDHITEQYLVNSIGLSRTPIREALLQLASTGILIREPRKGFRIKQFTKEDVEDIYEIIGTLDGRIAQLTANQLTEKDLSIMQFLIKSMDAAIDTELYTKYNELQDSFHHVYINKCHNKFLRKELDNKLDMFIGKSYLHIQKGEINQLLKSTNQEHKQILDLFKAGDQDKLRIFMENIHWSRTKAHYDIW